MAGATRRRIQDVERQQRDPPPIPALSAHIRLRRINIAWLSITRTDLLPGELVFNAADGTLVHRDGETPIRRYDSAASRAI